MSKTDILIYIMKCTILAKTVTYLHEYNNII